MEKEKVTAIIPCAGKGIRAGFDKNKLLVDYDKNMVICRTVSACEKSGLIDEIVLSVSSEDFDEMSALFPNHKIVLGGKTRTESVKNALKVVSGDIVLIHDGARPFITTKIIADAIESVKKFGSGICAIKSRDTIAKMENQTIESYLGKDDILSIQTPQAFYTKDIVKAYQLCGEKTFNDDGEVYKTYIQNPHYFIGDTNNIKLTYKEDFIPKDVVHFGNGFDCHKLVENRKLILGGIEIPHNKGLLGHSDADVLSHAIMDAILSGCGMRDIGYYFPDNDDKYLGANSIDLLKEVIKMITENGFAVTNVCATIMAQKPKLMPYIETIKQNLGKTLMLDTKDIGLGATTLEGLGFVGREEGICVYATCVVKKINN